MSIGVILKGNLGAAPVLRYVDIKGQTEKRPVCDLRLYADIPGTDDKGEYVDQGGSWFNLTIWGEAGVTASKILTKGMRVRAEGMQGKDSEWVDESTGVQYSSKEVTVSEWAILPNRIESITMRKSERSEAAGE